MNLPNKGPGGPSGALGRVDLFPKGPLGAPRAQGSAAIAASRAQGYAPSHFRPFGILGPFPMCRARRRGLEELLDSPNG